MDGLRSVWRRGGDASRLTSRDEHMAVADSLLAELDFHVQELDRLFQQRKREEQKMKTGVDYSWLVTTAPKAYKVPQLERLELEEMCLKLKVSECSRVVSLFRDAVLREPRVEELARVMRACVIQVLEQRPRSHSTASGLSTWVTQRAQSLANLKIKSATRVGPTHDSLDDNDIEMQSENASRTARAFSMPNFTVPVNDGPAVCVGDGDTGAYPV